MDLHAYAHARPSPQHWGFSLRKRSNRGGLMQEQAEEEEEEGRGWGRLRFDWGASGPLDVPAIIGPGYLQLYTARSRIYTRECCRRVRDRVGASNRENTKGEIERWTERKKRWGTIVQMREDPACVIIAMVAVRDRSVESVDWSLLLDPGLDPSGYLVVEDQVRSGTIWPARPRRCHLSLHLRVSLTTAVLRPRSPGVSIWTCPFRNRKFETFRLRGE